MKRFTPSILLCLSIYCITTESIRIHKVNRNSTKNNYGNSLHTPNHILEEVDINEMNYFNPSENIYDTSQEIKPSEVDVKSNYSNENELNESYFEEDLMDKADFNTISALKNKELLQNLKKTYYENDSENQKLIKHIKGILSRALHIPPKEVNLHDVNVLMHKWKIMNKNKQDINNVNSTHNIYHKEIQMHKPKQTDIIDWELQYGYDADKEGNNQTISLNYLMDIIS